MIRSKSQRGSSAPVSVRLTPEERAEIERQAEGQSLSTYIRARLFGGLAAPAADNRLSASTRQKLLAQILMRLGQTGLTEKLGELATAASLGMLDNAPDAAATLDALLTEVGALRRDLLRALGVRGREDRDP